ncbi:MAG: threonylcarbamoyl-AMP synthase [Clostridia bacterium]|nr:threonylcarbamoyl-AMP synthase [Clostridia bacterium]
MDTLLLSLKDDFDAAVDKAARFIRAGEVVGMPTETVYGLAANALDPDAVKKIFEAKGRPSDNPLIVHVTDESGLFELCRSVPTAALKLAERFWPGPLTIILKKKDAVPSVTSGGLDTVAVRCPSHPGARALIKKSGVPLAAPSANLSGKPSPTTFSRVVEDMDGRVACILDGGDCDVGVESTVVTLASFPPRLLRPGAVTLSELSDVLGEVVLDRAVLNPLEEGAAAASPGMKYRHYSPACRLTVVRGDLGRFAQTVAPVLAEGDGMMLFDGEDPPFPCPVFYLGPENDPAEQGKRLFSVLRELDDAGLSRAFCRAPSEQGFGLAVCNRLYRAAGFEFM